MLPPGLAPYLAHLVVAGVTLIISGAPGAGKTTFLRALAGSIPPFARALSMEEDPELDLDLYLPNCVGLRTRAANTESKGRVDLRELVRQSLRMAGSYAIVGECRGPEAWDLLKLCQIGTTVLATVHGDSCQDALHRLAELTVEGESQRTWHEALQLVASTVGVVVQLEGPHSTGLGMAVGHHRVVQVYEVLGLTQDRTRVRGQDLWALDPATDELVPTTRPTISLERIRRAGLAYEPPPVARDERREEVSG
jgi:Flp pilus assembly CpaF family ATPase